MRLHCSDISRISRSSVSKQHFVPKTKLHIGKRAFSVSAPTIWNQLPIVIKSTDTCCYTLNESLLLVTREHSLEYVVIIMQMYTLVKMVPVRSFIVLNQQMHTHACSLARTQACTTHVHMHLRT